MIAKLHLHIAPKSLSRAALSSSHYTAGRLWQSPRGAFSSLLGHRSFHLSWPLRTWIEPSPQSEIRHVLAGMPAEHKWGWVIYRCTYTDDSTWARFRARIEKDSREEIKNSDAPEIAERLEWTWVEDPALDGVSTAALRERFLAWAEEQIARQPGDYDPPVIPRFRFFIKVDQEALDSMVKSPPVETRWLDGAFVKLVDGHWEPLGEDKQAKDDDEEREKLQPIEGCTEEDVGWMCIVPDMIDSSFYNTLTGDPNVWFIFYERPPSILRY